MRLINVETLELESFADHRSTPPYAILSHTWGEDEILFQDVQPVTEATKHKLGWKKIEYTCTQAKKDDLKYAWVDTCCIDKSSSAELSEAINSMFAWYEESQICYAYLADVSRQPEEQLSCGADVVAEVAGVHAIVNGVPDKARKCEDVTEQERPMEPISDRGQGADTMCSGDEAATTPREERPVNEVGIDPLDIEPSGTSTLDSPPPKFEPGNGQEHDRGNRRFEEEFKSSRWFTRGWTLQEPIAPKDIRFYSDQWKPLGTLEDLAPAVASATTIPLALLKREGDVTKYCAARKMSWASSRKTTRIEDEAYCLLGIFGVNMPLLYGQREQAFRRLQEEILRTSGDISLFAWLTMAMTLLNLGVLLAVSPAQFSESGHIRTSPDATLPSISLRSGGVQANFQIASIREKFLSRFFVVLGCYDERFPTSVLALATKNVGSGNGSEGACNPMVLGVTGEYVDERLHLLQRDLKSRSLEVTLLYTNSDSGEFSVRGLRRICVEEISARQYHMNIPTMGPGYEWDFHIMSHDKDCMRVEGRATRTRAPNSFTLLVEPKTAELAERLDSAATSWRLEIVWDYYFVPDGSRQFHIRCYPLTRNKDGPCHTLRSFDRCPACASKKCKLFHTRESRVTSSHVSVFKGLGGGDQLRVHRSLLKNTKDSQLHVVLETARNPALESLRLRSTICQDGLQRTGTALPNLVKRAAYVVFPPKTRVSPKVYQGEYLIQVHQWERQTDPPRVVHHLPASQQ